jgi:hypothetical protein
MKIILGFCLSLLFITSCKKELSPEYGITNDRVGKLTRTTLINELESIYAQDSLVKESTSKALGGQSGKIEVYEKGGEHLLSITPNTDSIAKIGNVRIHDPRFTTQEGIGMLSTFKDIKAHFTIKKVVTSLNNVVVFLKDSDLYFTISKEELPADLRFGNTNIDVVQIPDQAKIKYMMVGWD